MADSLGLFFAFFLQHVDVVEEELSTGRHTDVARWTALHQILCLRQNPGVPQHAAANKDTADGGRSKPLDRLFGLDDIATPEDRDRYRGCNLGDEMPVGLPRVRLG